MTSGPAKPIAAIILAAGKGMRMRSAMHKVLHPVGGRPMLLHLLHSLESLAPQRIVVVAGDRAEQVESALAGTGAGIALQAEQLGTGHAVLMARPALAGFDGIALILFGDVPLVTPETLRHLVQALDGDRRIAVLGFRPPAPGAYGRIIATPDNRIIRMVEARDATPAELEVPLCNAGLMAADADLLFRLLARVGNNNRAGEYYLPDVVMLAAAEGIAATVVEAAAHEVVGVNDRAELAAAEALFQSRRRAELMAAGVTLVAPDTIFVSADTLLGEDTLVEPHVVIGPGVQAGRRVTIRAHSHIEGATIASDCEIGPFARLRPGTVLGEGAKIGNFVETKKAHFEAGAKANHLSYIGDAFVGAKANIGAGTITCNYDGFGKYDTHIGAGAFIGSNSALVAPVIIGDGAIVGAGSTITADVAADALVLNRAPQQERPGWAARFRQAMTARKGRN